MYLYYLHFNKTLICVSLKMWRVQLDPKQEIIYQEKNVHYQLLTDIEEVNPSMRDNVCLIKSYWTNSLVWYVAHLICE